MKCNEGLEELYCHLLGETALVYLKFGTYNDNRTSRVVDTLSEKVLTETSRFTLEHIGKRLKRSVSGAGNRTSATAVIDKCVNRFLKHSGFVFDDDIGSTEIHQLFQADISVEDSSVKVVEVACRESAAAFKRNKRSQIRRKNRKDSENHVFRSFA